MLRALLAIVLLGFVAGLAFFAGRSTVPPTTVTSTPPAENAAPAQTPPAQDPAADQTRARTEPAPAPAKAEPPMLPQAPLVKTDDALKGPTLPHSADAQAPGDSSRLDKRALGSPIANLKPADIHDTYLQSRSGGERRHEATDIMAAKGTPVLAVDTGVIAKLFTSKPGGLTVYQFDGMQAYAYYYAHLDRYAEGLREGMLVKKGDVIGYVGVTGNSDPNAPHLHFAIFELGPEKRWWEGKPINPYPFLMRAVGR